MDIVICGFDYRTTEMIIDAYTQGKNDYTATYVNVGAHREDKLTCHLRIGTQGECQYISAGNADLLRARTAEDARTHYVYIRETGTVMIDEEGDGRRVSQYAHRPEKEGIIKVVLPYRNMV